MRVLWLIAVVGSVFLALCVCGCDSHQYENVGYRPSATQFAMRMNELKDQEVALDYESEWLAQQDQELAAEWNAYKDLEAEFTSSLNNEQLDALGQLLTTDPPAHIEPGSPVSDVLSPGKSRDLDALLARKADLTERSTELEGRKKYHDLLILQHERRLVAESSAMIKPRRPPAKKRTHRPTGAEAAAAARQREAARRSRR